MGQPSPVSAQDAEHFRQVLDEVTRDAAGNATQRFFRELYWWRLTLGPADTDFARWLVWRGLAQITEEGDTVELPFPAADGNVAAHWMLIRAPGITETSAEPSSPPSEEYLRHARAVAAEAPKSPGR